MIKLIAVIALATIMIMAAPIIGLLLSLFGIVAVPVFTVLFPVLFIGGVIGYILGKKGKR